MIWTDWSSFWQMGGHAAYVWGSVATVILMMVAEMATLAVRDRDNALRQEANQGIEESL